MNVCGGEDVERRFVGRECDCGSADASMLEGDLKRYWFSGLEGISPILLWSNRPPHKR